MIDLDALKQLAETATPGPWEVLNQKTKFFIDSPKTKGTPNGRIADVQWFTYESAGPLKEESKANAHYIAACDPQTILALIEDAARYRYLRDECMRGKYCGMTYIVAPGKWLPEHQTTTADDDAAIDEAMKAVP